MDTKKICTQLVVIFFGNWVAQKRGSRL